VVGGKEGRGRAGGGGGVLLKVRWDWLLMAFELVDVEGEFEGGAELQAHVFHHHVAAQQQEGFAVNLLSGETCVNNRDDHEGCLTLLFQMYHCDLHLDSY